MSEFLLCAPIQSISFAKAAILVVASLALIGSGIAVWRIKGKVGWIGVKFGEFGFYGSGRITGTVLIVGGIFCSSIPIWNVGWFFDEFAIEGQQYPLGLLEDRIRNAANRRIEMFGDYRKFLVGEDIRGICPEQFLLIICEKFEHAKCEYSLLENKFLIRIELD